MSFVWLTAKVRRTLEWHCRKNRVLRRIKLHIMFRRAFTGCRNRSISYISVRVGVIYGCAITTEGNLTEQQTLLLLGQASSIWDQCSNWIQQFLLQFILLRTALYFHEFFFSIWYIPFLLEWQCALEQVGMDLWSISDQIHQSVVWTHASVKEIRHKENQNAVNLVSITNTKVLKVLQIYYLCLKYFRF